MAISSNDINVFGENFKIWCEHAALQWRKMDHQSWPDHDVAYAMRVIRQMPSRSMSNDRSPFDATADEQSILTSMKRQHVLNKFVRETPVFLGNSQLERAQNALFIAMPPRDEFASLLSAAWGWYEVVPASKRERVVNAIFTDLRSGGFRATDGLWKLIRNHIIGISRCYVDKIVKQHELRQIQNLPPAVVNPIRSQWPNERWQIDMFVLRDTRHKDRRFWYVAVLIDHFSKYVWTKWVEKPHAMSDEEQRFERHKYIFDWMATEVELHTKRTGADGNAIFGPDYVSRSVIDGSPLVPVERRSPGAHGRPNILQGDNEFSPKRSKHTVNWCLGSAADATARSAAKLPTYHGSRVQLVNSLPYQPKTNGLVERVNGTLKRMLRSWLYTTDTAVQISQNIFKRALADITRTYNSTKHSTTNFTPFEVYFGRTDKKLVENFHKRVRTFDNDEVTEIGLTPTPEVDSVYVPDPNGAISDADILQALRLIRPNPAMVTVDDMYMALEESYNQQTNKTLPQRGTQASLELIKRLPEIARQSQLGSRDEWKSVWPFLSAGGISELKCPRNRREVWHNKMGDPESEPSAELAAKKSRPGCSVFNWKLNSLNPDLHREICNYARWGINLGAEKMLKHTENKLRKQQEANGNDFSSIEVGTIVRLLKSKSEKFAKDGSSDSTVGKNWRKTHKGDGTMKSEELMDEREKRFKTTSYWTSELYVVIEVLKDTRDISEMESQVEEVARQRQKGTANAGEHKSRQTLVRHADPQAPAGRQGRQLTVYDKRTPLAVKLATRYRLAPLDETATGNPRPGVNDSYVHVSETCIKNKKEVRRLQEEYENAIQSDRTPAEVKAIKERLDLAKRKAREFNNYTSTMEMIEIRQFNDGEVLGDNLLELIEMYTTIPLKWCFYRTELWPLWPTKCTTSIPGYDREIYNVRTYRFKNDQRSKATQGMLTPTEMDQQTFVDYIRLAKEKAAKTYPVLIRASRQITPEQKDAAIALFVTTLQEIIKNKMVYVRPDLSTPHQISGVKFSSTDRNDKLDEIYKEEVEFNVKIAESGVIVGSFGKGQISFIES